MERTLKQMMDIVAAAPIQTQEEIISWQTEFFEKVFPGASKIEMDALRWRENMVVNCSALRVHTDHLKRVEDFQRALTGEGALAMSALAEQLKKDADVIIRNIEVSIQQINAIEQLL